MINILFCIDKNYKSQCKTVIRSILANTNEDVCFHIVGVKNFDCEANIKLYDTPDASIIKYKNVLNYISHTAVFRLFATKILDVDKVIYLDSDLIVLDDIKKLWEIETKYIAGCLDPMAKLHAKRNNLRNNYINSGVLLMNLKNLRKINYFERIEATQKGGYNLSLLDQDVINIAFNDIIKLLPVEWNVFSKIYPQSTNDMIRIRKNPSIIHWCGEEKPWNSDVWQKEQWRKYCND